jgi:hypothetical protein
MAPTRPAAPTTLIVVLGMHRSGTSVLARAMGALGADLGSHLQPPMAGVNDKGFFEDMDINAINMALMAAAGTEWDSLADTDLDHIPASQRQALEQQALALLLAKCGKGTFAFKDPRTSRLLPFWQPVFRRAGLRVRYAVAIRHPLSVSESLAGHFGHEPSPATDPLLWLAHTLPALTETTPADRIVVDYDRMLAAPTQEIARIAAWLHLPVDADEAQRFAEQFLDPALRTAQVGPETLGPRDGMPRAVGSLFQALSQAARFGDESQATGLPQAVSEAARLWQDLSPLLRREQELRARTRALQEQSTRQAEHLTTMQARITLLEQQARALERQAEALTGQLHAVHQQHGHLLHAHEMLKRSLSWRITAPMRKVLDLVRSGR